MNDRPFRFGVAMLFTPAQQWPAKSRQIEQLGFDLVGMTDYVGFLPPFPSLATAAAVTERIGIAAYTVNPALWNPAVLAREVLGTDALSGGRLELGVSSAQISLGRLDKYTAESVQWGDMESQLKVVGLALDTLVEAAKESDRKVPPILVACVGDAELDFAAERADTVCFIGGTPGPGGVELFDSETIAEQVDRVRAATNRSPELHIGIKRVVLTEDRVATAAELRPTVAPNLTDEQFLDLPTVLIGTHEQMADQLRRHAKEFGFSYFMVVDEAAERFAPVIELVRAG
jgi:probable F420-dependent oxidoreductase